jgi:hypothetical protein
VIVTRLYRLCGQAKELAEFLKIAGATSDELERAERLQDEPGVEFPVYSDEGTS